MADTDIRLEIAASPRTVADAFWDVSRWPALAPHVVGVDILYQDPTVQVLRMAVQARHRIEQFKTVRIRQSDAIVYLQPEPAPVFRHHRGAWQFGQVPAGTLVTSRHEIEIDAVAAEALLRDLGVPAANPEEVRNQLLALVARNTLSTMNALKRGIEAAHEEDHDERRRDAASIA